MRLLKKQKFYIIGLFVCLLSIMLLLTFILTPENIVRAEDEIYTINEDLSFAEDSVIVILDSEISEVNKVHSASFFKGISIKSITDLTKRTNPNLVYDSNFKQILRLELQNPSKENVIQSVKRLNRQEGIFVAEPSYNFEFSALPNDERFINGDQWNLMEDEGINIPKAWDITTGSKEVRVGIMDSGIASHPDLDANVTNGYDFYNENTITTDDELGHGTKVAGIIGAQTNNEGKGVAGINWNVTMVPMPVSFWDEEKDKYLFKGYAIENAIAWATDKWGTDEQIDIINYSGGTFGNSQYILYLINYYPGLFVWSAGNEGINVDDFPNIDLYNSENLISVGAIDKEQQRSIWSRTQSSCFGSYVNIYAPGGKGFIYKDNIPTTDNEQGYVSFNGTSAAAPHVTGVAALLLSANPTLTGAELKDIILGCADSITITVPSASGGTTTQTVKKLNAFDPLYIAGYKTTNIGLNEIRIDGINYVFGYDDVLTVPTTIYGRTVTEIGDSAFSNQDLCEEIVFPESLEIIGDKAFENCTSLTELHIPAAVTDIGAEAFKGCNGVTELIFEDDSNLYYIGSYAFYGCTSLEEVTIPASVVFIRKSAFEFCTGMETLTFEEGSSLRYAFGLEDNAFAYCQSLSEINYNVRALVGVSSNASVFAMARDSADIQLNIGAEVVWIFN